MVLLVHNSGSTKLLCVFFVSHNYDRYNTPLHQHLIMMSHTNMNPHTTTKNTYYHMNYHIIPSLTLMRQPNQTLVIGKKTCNHTPNY